MSGSGVGRLMGQVALVTGSTAGIGRALARGFAKEGARVWIHGRNAAAGQELASELKGRLVIADLAQPGGARSLAQAVVDVEERLDVLVNNAGLEVPMPVAELDPVQVERMWRVNVQSAMELVQLLLPLLRAAGGGSVINVTSIHETTPYAQNSVYCATKAALAMFGRTAAIELAGAGVRVNNLAPGAIETDINREVLDRTGRDRFADWIPMGRVGSVEDLVEPALFLATDASAYMTGATLLIDGGYSGHLVRYRPFEEERA